MKFIRLCVTLVNCCYNTKLGNNRTFTYLQLLFSFNVNGHTLVNDKGLLYTNAALNVN